MWNQNSNILTIKIANFGISSHKSKHHIVYGTERHMVPQLQPEVWGEDNRTKFPYIKAVDI